MKQKYDVISRYCVFDFLALLQLSVSHASSVWARGCKNRFCSVPWPEVVKGTLSQGVPCLYCVSVCEGSLGSRNSVCPSVTRVLCHKTKQCIADIWYHTKGQSLCYSYTNSGWWATLPSFWKLCSNWPTPFEKCRLRQISAYNISTVRDSEKSSIMTNIKSTTGFPTSYRWNAYITPKSIRIKSATKFLCVKTSGSSRI